MTALSLKSTDTAITCPCCGGWTLEMFEDTTDFDGDIVVMEICITCSAIVNRSGLEVLRANPEGLRDTQVNDLERVYATSGDLEDELREEIEAHGETLRFFLSQIGVNGEASDFVCAELGIGRGTLLRAAAARFKRCYGIDLAYELFDMSAKHVAVPDNVMLVESITHVPDPLDAVFAWHCFEHVPRLYELISTIRSSLKPGGHIFFQVPLYRPRHLVASHYVFLNWRAIRVMAEVEGFEVVDMWTDHPRDVITALLRKPAR